MLGISRIVCTLSLTLAVGCGHSHKPVTIPDTADGTVETVLEGIVDQNPRVLWAALPGSYQSDITGLIHQFGRSVDEEIYNESFNVVRKVARILRTKKSFILNHPMAAGMFADYRISKNWDAFINVFETLANSEFSSVSSLRRLDMDQCLKGTGAEFMEQLAVLSRMSPEDPMAALKDARVELIKSSGTTATVKVTVPAADKPAEEVRLTKVEGRWVPTEMAMGWSKGMEKARKGLEKMASDKSSTMQAKMGLGMANAVLDQLESASTQEEFNEVVNSLFGSFATPR